MKFKTKGVDQAEVNADLLARFGTEVSRQDLLAWRKETGIDPKWIRRNAACRIGRGMYRIPSGESPVAPYKMAKHERPVLPTPFDDGAYDDVPVAETTAPAKGRRGRKRVDEDDSQALINQPDYDPVIGERAPPTMIHAWVCTAEGCPGRKPGSFYADDKFTPPTCECGSSMTRHSWTKKIRF